MSGKEYTGKYDADATVTFNVAPDGSITDGDGNKVTYHDFTMTARSRTVSGRNAKQAASAAQKLAKIAEREAKLKTQKRKLQAQARRAAKAEASA